MIITISNELYFNTFMNIDIVIIHSIVSCTVSLMSMIIT